MKIQKTFKILAVTSAFFVASCASTKVDEVNQIEETKENKTETDNQEVEQTEVVEETPVTVVVENKVKIKKEDLLNFKAEVVATPKEISKNGIFKSPYSLKFENYPEDLEILVTYPSKYDEDFNIVYETAKVPIENDGTLNFTPPSAHISAKDKISFSPYVEEANDELKAIIEEKTVTADYKVRTNLTTAGGVVALVEFKKDGKPVYEDSISSSRVLIELINSGFRGIGNDNFTNLILKENPSQLFDSANEKYQKSQTYLIYGTVKYEDIEDSENAVNLIADISCMNLKAENSNAEDLFFYKKVIRVGGKDIQTARIELGKIISEKVNYGM